MKKFFFSVVEEGIRNESFIKKYPNMRGGRIEVFYKDEPYDVDEIRFMLPEDMFIPFLEAFEFKECDYFQIGNHHSEDIEKKLKLN